MTAAVYNIEEVEITSNERRSKEIDMLPVPSTTPASKRETTSANYRLATILQYINPLFYARLAQAFIYSVLESYRESGAGNYNARITAGNMVAVPNLDPPVSADSTAIDCGPPMLTEINLDDNFTSVAPEFDVISHPDTGNIETTPPHESSVHSGSRAMTEEQHSNGLGTNVGEAPQCPVSVSDKLDNPVESAQDVVHIPDNSQFKEDTSVDQQIQADLPATTEDHTFDPTPSLHSSSTASNAAVGLEQDNSSEVCPPTMENTKKSAKKTKRGKAKSKNRK
ncbi:hypothetical protein LPJ73_005256 [Coemansia sp. RSA 2703]|nr:hypothetical protein LPJ73_005256 [Coemansia sp. RSA 2703]